MSYFLPSSIQKRVLRFVLSTQGLLEIQDLDLDNLGIAWGMRSTVELRDIGLSTHKLSALLQLPPALTLVTARILLLRVTIPANIFSGSISIEVDGVDVRLSTDTKAESGDGHKTPPGADGSRAKRKGKTAGRARSTKRTVQNTSNSVSGTSSKGSNKDDGTSGNVLPSTFDIAQSFIQGERPEERAELHAAVASSLDLDASQVVDESIGDSVTLGVGGGISMPGFLANLLKGVRDRMEICIANVEISLDTQLGLPAHVLEAPGASEIPENLIIKLVVEKVDIEGVTNESSATNPRSKSMPDELCEEDDLARKSQQAVRRISLRNIQGMIISDMSLFMNLSRFSVPPSPNKASSSRGCTSTSESEPTLSNPSSRAHNSEPVRSRHLNKPTIFRSTASAAPRDDIESSDDSDQLSSAATFSGFGHQSSFSHSQYHESVLTGSFYSTTGDSDPSVESHAGPSYSGNEREDAMMTSQSPISTPLGKLGVLQEGGSDQATDMVEDAPENLAESKIFSHEEAQSMYMSALSHDSRTHRGHDMPGNWDSSSSEDDTLTTRMGAAVKLPSEQEKHAPQQDRSVDRAPVATEKLESAPEMIQEGTLPDNTLHEAPVLERTTPATEDFSHVKQVLSENSGGSSESSDTVLFSLKKIIAIDLITVDIPQTYDQAVEGSAFPAQGNESVSPDLSRPCHQNISRARVQHAGQGNSSDGPADSSHLDLSATTKESKPSTSISLGDVSILGDLGLTKLTIMLAQKFMDIVKQKPQAEKANSAIAEVYSHTNVVVRRISWQFLDVVRGFTTSRSLNLSAEARAAPMSDDTDVLLKAIIRDLTISLERRGNVSVSTTSIKKLVFGYATDNILSFDPGLRLRESTRDIVLGPVDHDIVLKISDSSDRSHIEITTLPLHLHLDLRRLDETFGWFGGFSSILGLGSSVISTVTVTEGKSRPLAAKPARGVRFEDTIQTPEKVPSPQQKITARLGGIIFDLQGNSSAFRLETSALKLVSRAEGIGLSVDRLKISGPYCALQSKEPSINVKLSGLRVEYLSNPKEIDLTRLLALLCPSNDNFEQDDDILVDTLLRQRRQGGVIRLNVDSLISDIGEMADLKQLPTLGDDLKKLSAVAKYIPEDDRPGIMTLFLVRDANLGIDSGDHIGTVGVTIKNIEAAYISLPSLIAFSVHQLEVRRNNVEELVGVVSPPRPGLEVPTPMVMARFVGNELEPTVKLKLQSIRVEYHVTTVMAVLGLPDDISTERFVSDMVSSVATVTARTEFGSSPPQLSAQTSTRSDGFKSKAQPLAFDLLLRDVVVGLNPRDCTARGVVVLSTAKLNITSNQDDDLTASLEVHKASFLAIDDINGLAKVDVIVKSVQVGLLQRLSTLGYVSLVEVSAAKVALHVLRSAPEADITTDLELRDTLMVLESCADSTQTMQMILNGLQPPLPPSKETKYRTEIMPVEDMLASFSGDAFATHHQSRHSSIHSSTTQTDEVDDEDVQDLEFVSSFYGLGPEGEDEDVSNSLSEKSFDSMISGPARLSVVEATAIDNSPGQPEVAMDVSALDFREDHFGNSSTIGGTAHRWDTRRNTYELADDSKLRVSPLRLRVRDVHIIWNLFDGYDWQHTRDTIGEAVAAIEGKAIEQRSRRNKRKSLDPEEEEDSVIGDFLFNSIYIGIASNHDPKDLNRQINRNIDDLVSESESYATSTVSSSPSRQTRPPRAKSRKLRLMRSRSHKMTFELKGLSADLVVFPPGSGETQSSLDIRVQDLEVFDHLPTSTWKKFATYMHDAGEREAGTSMVHIELLNVKPVPDLAASEIILKVRGVNGLA